MRKRKTSTAGGLGDEGGRRPMRDLTFPSEPSRIWTFAMGPYREAHNGMESRFALKGPYETDQGDQVFRARDRGTRYKFLFLPAEEALERFIAYAVKNMDCSERPGNGVVLLGISSYAEKLNEEGSYTYKKFGFRYAVRKTSILDSPNIALSATVMRNGRDDGQQAPEAFRTKDFPPGEMESQLVDFLKRLCLERYENFPELKWG